MLAVDPAWLVERLRQAHRADGFKVGRCYLEAEAGQGFLLWPAWERGRALGAKLVTVFPDNAARGPPPNHHSVYVLFDGDTGAPRAVLTGAAFTQLKTAADSALGATFLARTDVRRLAVLGAGAQAAAHVRALLAVRPSLARVTIWNRTPGRAEALAGRLRAGGIAAEATGDRAAAVRAADVVTCLTGAREPVLEGAWLAPGTHVDLVGGFTPAMRESDDAAILRARVFADHRALVLAHAGDLCDPIGRGIIGPGHVQGDLFDLCEGRVAGRRAADEVTLFKNGSGGHLDLMVACALAE